METVAQSRCPWWSGGEAALRGSTPPLLAGWRQRCSAGKSKPVVLRAFKGERKGMLDTAVRISPCFSPPGCGEIGISLDHLIKCRVSFFSTCGKRDLGWGYDDVIWKQAASSAFITVGQKCHRKHNILPTPVPLVGSSSCFPSRRGREENISLQGKPYPGLEVLKVLEVL